jgi:DNA polymerase-3 subunit gamma/tau
MNITGAGAMPASTDQSWSDKYRPRRFEDVVGQKGITARLATYVRSAHPPHLILSGPSGTGKTTLLQIYAQALICAAPLDTGSPCGTCDFCFSFISGSPGFVYLNCAQSGSKETIEGELESAGYSPLWGRRNVILFDEAHRLSPGARDALLTILEDERTKTTLLFALIDPILPLQLRSRCRELRLSAPTTLEAVQYVNVITAAEDLLIDDGARKLITLASPSFRSIAQHMQALAELGRHITVDKVRSELLHDRSAAIINYLECLASGDLAGQLMALHRTTLSPVEVLNALRRALTHLNLRHVVVPSVALPDDPSILLFPDDACAAAMAAFRRRADALGMTLMSLFDAVLEFWQEVPAHVDHETIRILVQRFHNALTDDRSFARRAESISGKPGAMLPPRMSAPRPAARRAIVFGGPYTPDAWLSRRQVNELYEASSFLMQRYGACFNAIMQFDHLESVKSDRDAAARVNRLSKEMRQQVERYGAWNNGRPACLHRITLHERIKVQLTTTVMLHIDMPIANSLIAWLDQRLPSLGLPSSAGDVLQIVHHEKSVDRVARHWQLTRQLLGGIAPDLSAGGALLTERFRIPRSRQREAGLIHCDRYSMAETLSRGARDKAHAAGRAHLSALADEAYEHLFNGWELEEHRDVSSQIFQRQKERALLLKELAKADDQLSKLNIFNLINQLDNDVLCDPYSRKRSWGGWWE